MIAIYTSWPTELVAIDGLDAFIRPKMNGQNLLSRNYGDPSVLEVYNATQQQIDDLEVDLLWVRQV